MSEKKPYKVLFEAVTQGKKKLKSSITYHETAASGYTFVPVGKPELTDYCKELSRKRGVDMRIVSARPFNLAMHDPTHISHHIHRIGYHFRNDVVDTACIQIGLKTTRQGRPYRNSRNAGEPDAMARRMDVRGKEMGQQMHLMLHDSEKQKEAASRAIRDLFPKIPDDDRRAVIGRAFEEGAGRIGEQNDIPLSRRVQLAVTAHIRHTKTDYDNLLKQTDWGNARKKVEQGTLDQIIKWRGEGNDDDGELEEILEEVIVLDDVSDDEVDDEQPEDKETSVEILTHQHEFADPDAESPLHATRQGLPRAQNRLSPNIISVKPMRIPRSPPIITQEAMQQRMHESRARMGYYGHVHERPKDRYVLAPEYQPKTYECQDQACEQSRARLRPANDVSPRAATSITTQHSDPPNGRFPGVVESHALPLKGRPFPGPVEAVTSWQSPNHRMMRNGDHSIRPSVEVPRVLGRSPRQPSRTFPGLGIPLGRERLDEYSYETQSASHWPQARIASGYVAASAQTGHHMDMHATAPLTAPLRTQRLGEDVIDLTDDSPPGKRRELRDPRYRPYSRPSNLRTRRSASPELSHRREYSTTAPSPSRQMTQSYGAERNELYRHRSGIDGPDPSHQGGAASPHTFYEITGDPRVQFTRRNDQARLQTNGEPRHRPAFRPEQVLRGYDEYVQGQPAREQEFVYVPVQPQSYQAAYASRVDRNY